MGLDWTVDSEQLDYKSTARAVLKMAVAHEHPVSDKSYENQNQVEKNIFHRQVTKVLISIAGVWMRVSRVWHPVAF